MAVNTTTGSATVTNSTAAQASTSAASSTDASDRFLKLLVAQMKNQDPLNPMDNAQVTSQMAQIQTVNGVEKLNTTVAALNTQFVQLQALSGAGLVGKDVLVEGNRMLADDTGVGHAGVELATPADSVTVEVQDGSGRVIDTVDLGALGAGRHSFDWIPPSNVDPAQAVKFRVSARLAATDVKTTALARDRVDAVSTDTSGLVLELANAGPVPYDKVKAFD
ncbi:flagellar hook capping protein [Burkholderiales bacterium JOSHI_001]|nr:flagellar hook capping protein [Burkholderiales bacterium JOSHI_001]